MIEEKHNTTKTDGAQVKIDNRDWTKRGFFLTESRTCESQEKNSYNSYLSSPPHFTPQPSNPFERSEYHKTIPTKVFKMAVMIIAHVTWFTAILNILWENDYMSRHEY